MDCAEIKKTYLGNEINFNQTPKLWAGVDVFPAGGEKTSNHYTSVIAVQHPLEPFIPDIFCQGNVYIEGNEDIGGSLIVGDVSAVVEIGFTTECGTLVALEIEDRLGLNPGDVYAYGDVYSNNGGHILSAKKNFDIPHPTKEGWRLTHTCVEGPEAAVYVRGRVRNKTEINLPEYWKGLVDIDTITINLTPIGAHQDVIVKRWDDEKVYLQAKGNMPINCFYYIMAERADTEKLIPEYEGTIEDYPGDNSQRSIAGYHYDTKENN